MDIIIIGAGASGLMAARILSAKGKKVLVLEGRERLGGRIHTNENTFTSNAEAGAEFIHGNLKLTRKLLKEAGINQLKVAGGIYSLQNGVLEEHNDFVEDWGVLMQKLKEVKTDITVNEFLDQCLPEERYASIKKSFKNYVQGYDAADINRASVLSIRDEMQQEDDATFRVEQGYGGLITFLAEEIKKNGGTIITGQVVNKINWQTSKVDVITADKSFQAAKVIITVPAGVLQCDDNLEGSIKFSPAIKEQQNAIKQIGFGGVIKIVLEFEEAFWFNKEFLKVRNIDEPFFLFSDEFIPTWWTQYPDTQPILTGWLAGPESLKHSNLPESEFVHKSLESLAAIFKMNEGELQKKLNHYSVYNWVNDPFSRGAYSYTTLTSKEAISFLKLPVDDSIYFAGEAFAAEPTATVDAALQSGEEVAKLILDTSL